MKKKLLQRAVVSGCLLAGMMWGNAMAAPETVSLQSDAGKYKVSITEDSTVFKNLTIENLATKDVLQAAELFTIKMEDGTVLKSSEFKVADVQRTKDYITANFTNDRFKVAAKIDLKNGKTYSSIKLGVSAIQKDEPLSSISMIPFHMQMPHVSGNLVSSPIISHSFYIMPDNPTTKTVAYEGGVSQTLPVGVPLEKGKMLETGTYVGTYTEGQLRRDFNTFLNEIRPRPYAPYLHYNTWLDIGFFNRYTEAQGLERIHQFGEKMVKERGVHVASFLFDDGWDDMKGDWKFHENFPNQFYPLKAAAEEYKASLGVWLSPWGGYNKPKKARVSNAERLGFETIDGGFALSGPKYYEVFHKTILDMINDQNIVFFKLDGTGNADKVIKGSKFNSDFDAAIHLLKDMRAANPNVFINLTTGTYASPSWLLQADSIWRGGDDVNFVGKGSYVQQWITYRDASTHHDIVEREPLFPIHSLMLHGLIYAQQAAHLDKQSPKDFADQVWSYFGTGTQLQELYVTPTLLTENDWNVMAKAANWSYDNQKILLDVHWIGGSPYDLDVYGWAAWSQEKSLITLRNPSDQAQAYYFDAKAALEIPQGQSTAFATKVIYGSNASIPAKISSPTILMLQPFETIVLEFYPQK